MSEDVSSVLGDEGVAALLGFAVVQAGGEIRIPLELVQDGLPEGRVRATFNNETDEMILKIVID
jgi:hypothetical protein